MPPKTRGSSWRRQTQKRFGSPPSDTSSRDSGELRVSDLLNARSPRQSPYRRSPKSPRASTPILGNTSIPPLRASSLPLSIRSEPSSSRVPRRTSSLPNRSPNITPNITGTTLDYTNTTPRRPNTGATPRRLIRNILGLSGTRPRTPSFTGLDPMTLDRSGSGSRSRSRSGSRSQFSLSNTPPPPLPSLNISSIRRGGSTGRGRGRGKGGSIRIGRGRGGSIRGRGTGRGGIRGRGRGTGRGRGIGRGRIQRIPRHSGGGGGDSSGGGSSSSSGRSLLHNSPNFGPLDRRRGKRRKVTVTETRTVTTVRKGKPPRVNRTSRRHSY